jgi:hypothetical protein
VDKLEANGVALRILDFSGNAVDTRGATGRLMLNMFAAMAQFEREMMLERQREGIAKAKAQGKYKGRKPADRHLRLQGEHRQCEPSQSPGAAFIAPAPARRGSCVNAGAKMHRLAGAKIHQ